MNDNMLKAGLSEKTKPAAAREKSGRVDVYDWLRLIATIFVVIGHSAYLGIREAHGGIAYELPAQLHPVYNSQILSWLRWLSVWVYGFHMPLFFILSGAVLALKPVAPFDKFFKSKVKRLLVPYFVWGWLYMFPVKRLGGFYDNRTVFEGMCGFLNGEDAGHLWFLPTLFWCMLVFCILYKCFQRAGIKSGYLLLLCCGVIQLAGPSFLPFDVLDLKAGLSYIFYFALGYQFELERRAHKRWSTRATVLAFIAVFGLEYVNDKVDPAILNKFFTIIAGSVFTFLLADLCARVFTKASRVRAWNLTIRNLFYVYIFHDPLEYLVLRGTWHYHLLSSAVGCVMYVLMRTAVVFIIGVLLGELVETGKRHMSRLWSAQPGTGMS